MKKYGLVFRLALAATITLAPLPEAAFGDGFTPAIGDFASDGSVYAGVSPDAHQPMYTTPEDAPDLFIWNDGQNYCGTLESFGHKDWRVPTKRELNVLYDNRNTGGLNVTFKVTGAGSAGWYWSSAEYDGNQAWVQRFSNGEQSYDYQDDKSSLRCVR
jgi:hypothetical protein